MASKRSALLVLSVLAILCAAQPSDAQIFGRLTALLRSETNTTSPVATPSPAVVTCPVSPATTQLNFSALVVACRKSGRQTQGVALGERQTNAWLGLLCRPSDSVWTCLLACCSNDRGQYGRLLCALHLCADRCVHASAQGQEKGGHRTAQTFRSASLCLAAAERLTPSLTLRLTNLSFILPYATPSGRRYPEPDKPQLHRQLPPGCCHCGRPCLHHQLPALSPGGWRQRHWPGAPGQPVQLQHLQRARLPAPETCTVPACT